MPIFAKARSAPADDTPIRPVHCGILFSSKMVKLLVTEDRYALAWLSQGIRHASFDPKRTILLGPNGLLGRSRRRQH